MNSINLTGRLTADVELKQTQNGVHVCSFRIAVKRPNVKDETDFINCTAWRSTAEFVARYFGKGSMIAVTGYLISRKYEDKNGNKRTDWEVVCDRCEFCDSKGSSTTEHAPEAAPHWQTVHSDEDLPF